jgi:hypothetical protein
VLLEEIHGYLKIFSSMTAMARSESSTCCMSLA